MLDVLTIDRHAGLLLVICRRGVPFLCGNRGRLSGRGAQLRPGASASRECVERSAALCWDARLPTYPPSFRCCFVSCHTMYLLYPNRMHTKRSMRHHRFFGGDSALDAHLVSSPRPSCHRHACGIADAGARQRKRGRGRQERWYIARTVD